MSKKGIGRGLGRRQFVIERLEPRALLAGQVSAVNSGGDLIIRGDDSNNQIAVSQLDSGAYVIVGLSGTHIKNNDGTTSGHEFRVVGGIDGNVDIDLKKGNDILAIGNDANPLIDKITDLPGFGSALGVSSLLDTLASALNSALGNAGGTVGGEFDVSEHLIIRMRDGNDAVAINNAHIGLRIDADLGDGNNGLAVDPTFVGDDIILRAGKGNDTVSLLDTDIAQMLDVNLGDGTNDFEMEDSELMDDVRSHVGESVVLNTGKGNDRVNFEYTDVDLDFIIRTGAGNDFVNYNGGEVGPPVPVAEVHAVIGHVADINTGSGNDRVQICDADIGLLDGGAEIGWGLKINTEDGVDGVFVGCEGPSAAQFGGATVNIGDDLLIFLGSGDDGLASNGHFTGNSFGQAGATVQSVDIVDNLEVHGDAGNDRILVQEFGVGHDAFVTGNDGNDNAVVQRFLILDDLHYEMGAGNDVGGIANGNIGHNLFVDLGAGNDGTSSNKFNVAEVRVVNDVFLDAGAGNDRVLVQVSSAHNFTAKMGSGNDTLDLVDNTITGKAKLDGGSGQDTLFAVGNTFNEEEEKNFEIF